VVTDPGPAEAGFVIGRSADAIGVPAGQAQQIKAATGRPAIPRTGTAAAAIPSREPLVLIATPQCLTKDSSAPSAVDAAGA
jgi:hypothetical protein